MCAYYLPEHTCVSDHSCTVGHALPSSSPTPFSPSPTHPQRRAPPKEAPPPIPFSPSPTPASSSKSSPGPHLLFHHHPHTHSGELLQKKLPPLFPFPPSPTPTVASSSKSSSPLTRAVNVSSSSSATYAFALDAQVSTCAAVICGAQREARTTHGVSPAGHALQQSTTAIRHVCRRPLTSRSRGKSQTQGKLTPPTTSCAALLLACKPVRTCWECLPAGTTFLQVRTCAAAYIYVYMHVYISCVQCRTKRTQDMSFDQHTCRTFAQRPVHALCAFACCRSRTTIMGSMKWHCYLCSQAMEMNEQPSAHVCHAVIQGITQRPQGCLCGNTAQCRAAPCMRAV